MVFYLHLIGSCFHFRILIYKCRKFKTIQRERRNGSHAYSVGCYHYICMQGFLRPPNKDVALQFHASWLIMVLVGAGEHITY